MNDHTLCSDPFVAVFITIQFKDLTARRLEECYSWHVLDELFNTT